MPENQDQLSPGPDQEQTTGEDTTITGTSTPTGEIPSTTESVESNGEIGEVPGPLDTDEEKKKKAKNLDTGNIRRDHKVAGL